MANEMAHYACDCWDAEILTSYGWVECVGCADRSAFDLTQHSEATGIKLSAEKRLPQPVSKDITEILPNKVKIHLQQDEKINKFYISRGRWARPLRRRPRT